MSLVWILGCFSLVVGIGLADWQLGYEISVSIFYLIPITGAVYFGNLAVGMIAAAVAAMTWLAADLWSGHHYSFAWMPYWNMTVRGGYFLLHAWIFSRFLQFYRTNKEAADHDNLTGAANSRFFYRLLREVQSRSRETSLALVYIDLDDFKKMNDSFGHQAGDELLRQLVTIISDHLRGEDCLARLGGDEFGLLLPGRTRTTALNTVSEIHAAVTACFQGRGWPVGMSAGAIVFHMPFPDPDAMVREADDLMYEVKKQGKNHFRIRESAA